MLVYQRVNQSIEFDFPILPKSSDPVDLGDDGLLGKEGSSDGSQNLQWYDHESGRISIRKNIYYLGELYYT